MRKYTAEREESRDEMALRVTLPAHASETVDTDAAWDSVAPRLATNRPLAARQRRTGPLVGWAGRPRRALVAAIMVAVLLVSIGSLAGFAYIRGCFWGGSSFICSNLLQPDGTNYFDKVNQSQEQHGVTVTITSAYADRGATLIGYRATMTPGLAARWAETYPAAMTVTTDAGELVGTMGDKSNSAAIGELCDDPARNRGETVCYFHFGPAHPGDTASSISLSIEITKIDLHNGPSDTLLAGSWRFHFTLPFHQLIRDLDTTK
jgi:uncharacterized protein DUF4179